MKSSRIAFGAVLLALACQVPKTISQENPFVKFTVSGTFDNSDKLALSGWFIVNENNGLVVRADLFHGSAEFASLPVGQGQEGGDFFLSQSNSHLDTLNLIFPAPGNDGSLAGYTGGVICSNLYSVCPGVESSFFDGQMHSYYGEDLVYVGSISKAGHVPSVRISIKPHGEGPALIDPRSHSLSTIAIISTGQFDAVTDVDTTSLTFGPTGLEQSITSCNKDGRDVNGDRVPDLICHFNPRLTQFLPSESLGILVGKTTQGTPIVGFERVAVMPMGK